MLKTDGDFTCGVTCKEVRLGRPEDKNGVSRAFFHPEIAAESNFLIKKHGACDTSEENSG